MTLGQFIKEQEEKLKAFEKYYSEVNYILEMSPNKWDDKLANFENQETDKEYLHED